MADSLDQACSARASVWSTSGLASLRSAGLRRILPGSAITLPNFTALASIAVAPPTAVLHATEAIGPAMVAGRCVVEEAAAVPAGRSSDQATAPTKTHGWGPSGRGITARPPELRVRRLGAAARR